MIYTYRKGCWSSSSSSYSCCFYRNYLDNGDQSTQVVRLPAPRPLKAPQEPWAPRHHQSMQPPPSQELRSRSSCGLGSYAQGTAAQAHTWDSNHTVDLEKYSEDTSSCSGTFSTLTNRGNSVWPGERVGGCTFKVTC